MLQTNHSMYRSTGTVFTRMRRSTALKYAILIPVGYFVFSLLPWRGGLDNIYGDKIVQNKRFDTRVVQDGFEAEQTNPGQKDCNSSKKSSPDVRECETVHVLFFCDGAPVAREISLLSKTLMFYRLVPLHLHFICDDTCTTILQTLFDTWDIQHLAVSFYKSKSGSKLVLPHVHTYLPQTVEKVIYLHHDMRILSDISELWSEFDKFSEYQFIGIVRNEGAGQDKRDFYDEILLLRLDLMRKSRPLAGYFENHLSRKKIGSVAAGGTFGLPCSWRLDLTNVTHCEQCLSHGHAQAVVWGHKSDKFVKSALVEDIKERLAVVIDSSPYSVSNKFLCSIDSDKSGDIRTSFSEKTCEPYRFASKLKRRTHLYYIGAPLKEPTKDKYDISLLTQLTLDRFSVFEKFMNNWEGPAAAVFHVSETDALRLPAKVAGSKILKNRTNIAYHIVYKRQRYYPINYLRNVAVNQTKTPYALFVDVDLVASPGIYARLKKLVAQTASKPNVTLVVPAFEALEELKSFPGNKEAVLDYMKNKKVVGYRMNRGWNLGHRPTDFNKWQIAEEPYKVKWKDAFEPYVVMETGDNMPKYHEGLLERMGDKIAYGREIYARGYEFWVIPDVYVIHLPHPSSEGTELWKKEPGYMRCGAVLITEFKDLLKRQHPYVKF